MTAAARETFQLGNVLEAHENAFLALEALASAAFHQFVFDDDRDAIELRRFMAATGALRLRRCVLEVANDNSRAVALYERFGFEEIGRAIAVDPDTGKRLGYLHLAKRI